MGKGSSYIMIVCCAQSNRLTSLHLVRGDASQGTIDLARRDVYAYGNSKNRQVCKVKKWLEKKRSVSNFLGADHRVDPAKRNGK